MLYNTSDTERVLAERFLEKQNQFKESHTLLSLDDFTNQLKIKGKNRSCSIYELRKSNKIIALNIDGDFFYPSFQLDNTGNVYSEIIKGFPRVSKYFSAWDFAFWITDMHTLVLNEPSLDFDIVENIAAKQLSLDELIMFIENELEPTNSITEVPLTLLKNGDYKMFSNFITSLIVSNEW